jgi:hypothetical protein
MHRRSYQCPIAGAMDQLSDRPRLEPNRVGIVNRLAERREQAHQCDETERRYVVAGIAPNFEFLRCGTTSRLAANSENSKANSRNQWVRY